MNKLRLLSHEKPWTSHEQVMRKSWANHEHAMNKQWKIIEQVTSLERNINNLWSRCDQVMKKCWTSHGWVMKKEWTIYVINKSGTAHEQEVMKWRALTLHWLFIICLFFMAQPSIWCLLSYGGLQNFRVSQN